MYIKSKDINEIIDNENLRVKAKKHLAKKLNFYTFILHKLFSNNIIINDDIKQRKLKGTYVDFHTFYAIKKDYRLNLAKKREFEIEVANIKFDTARNDKIAEITSEDKLFLEKKLNKIYSKKNR